MCRRQLGQRVRVERVGADADAYNLRHWRRLPLLCARHARTSHERPAAVLRRTAWPLVLRRWLLSGRPERVRLAIGTVGSGSATRRWLLLLLWRWLPKGRRLLAVAWWRLLERLRRLLLRRLLLRRVTRGRRLLVTRRWLLRAIAGWRRLTVWICSAGRRLRAWIAPLATSHVE